MSRRFSYVLRRIGRGLALLALGGCVDSYLPEVVSANATYLVVDGFINGNGRSTFLLSRTENIAATTVPPVETGATLYLADDTGRRYSLSEVTSGTYQSDSLVLDPRRQYQLSIRTSRSASYASDLVPLKVTPPLDKLGFALRDGQVQLQLSTHDASAQSRYYRWQLSETWQFNAAYQSRLEYRGGIIQSRITPIYTCWRTERPSGIQQRSTAALSQDILTDVPLASPSANSERFKIRYSALVSQYVETAAEFAYFEQLRKNTEAVGTVNDPLPVQLTGNVHRLDNATEPVLGFVGAHTIQRQRLFISRQDLPFRNDDDFDTPYKDCAKQDTAEILYPYLKMSSTAALYPNSLLFGNAENVPIDLIYPSNPVPGFPVFGYSGSTAACADCRTRGTTTKPSFW